MGLNTIVIVTLLSFVGYTLCQNDQCNADIVWQVRPDDADVKFSVIVTLRQSEDGVNCGSSVSSRTVQNLAVLEWTVAKLNGGNFVDGVTIGFDVYDDCGIPRRSMRHGLGVADSPRLGTTSCINGTTCQIGILGTSNSSTTDDLLFALRGTSVPVISPYATYPALADYPDFYRTTPSDERHIQVVADLLQQLDLTYVAVVTTDTDYGQYASQQLKSVAKEMGICVDVIETIEVGGRLRTQKLLEQRGRTKHNTLRVVYFGSRASARVMFQQLRFEPKLQNISWILSEHPEDEDQEYGPADELDNGTIIVRRSEWQLDSVQEYVRSKWNAAIASPNDRFSILMNEANAGSATLPEFHATSAVHTIDSVFMIAAALQRQHSLYCQGTSGPCKPFKEYFLLSIAELQGYPIYYPEYGANVTVTEFNETKRRVEFLDNREVSLRADPELSLFDIVMVDGDTFIQVGSFIRDSLEIVNRTGFPTSMCKNSCPMCVDIPDIPFAYMDGDSFILGILSIHEVDPTNYFKCGEFRRSHEDVVNVENLFHSVNKMRSETGLKVGAIVIDDCYSSARTGLILSQVFSGKVKLLKPGSDVTIDVTKILAVVIGSGSTVTISVALLMMQLQTPVIASAASSPDLDDRVNFPYFLRTVPSDTEQARAMVDIIVRMKWTYVSILYSENNYGSKGKEAFIKAAVTRGICVAESPEGISDIDTISDFKAVFTRLRNDKSDVVVYFGTETLIMRFLEAVDGANDFVFLASEDWGSNKKILDYGRGALGSISLKNQGNGITDGQFKQYLLSLKPESNTRNPWFVEYWEDLFDCDLESSFNNRYTVMCHNNLTLDNDLVEEFLNDQRLVHIADAIKVIGRSLKIAKDEYCKLEDVFPCAKYFKYIDDIVVTIRSQTITRDGKEVNVFKSDGNGNIGFEINNVQQINTGSETSLEYIKVGTYDEGILALDPQSLVFYRNDFTGRCRDDKCLQCQFNTTKEPITVTTTTHIHPAQNEFATPDYTIIGILGFLFLVIVITAIVSCCYFRRRIKELEKQLKKTTYELRTSDKLQSQSYTSGGSTTHPLHMPSSHPGHGTTYEFDKAMRYLKMDGTPNGIVNNGFVGDEMYIHPSHGDLEDENQNVTAMPSPRRDSSPHKSPNKRSSKDYRPTSQTSYGVSTHHSFKKPADGQVKIQPRTQLNVPPCRPELPPRESAYVQRPNGFPENFDHLPTAVPKDKHRKIRSNPKRNMSPQSIGRSPSLGSPQYKNHDVPDPFNGSPQHLAYSSDMKQFVKDHLNDQSPEREMINMAGSMEKISRV